MGIWKIVGRASGVAAAVALVVSVFVTGCAPQGAQTSPELAALSDRWMDALATGDLDKLVSMYTTDARLMAPHEATAQGTEAVRASFGGMIESGLRVELENSESVVSGDMGYKSGVYSVVAPDGSVADRGKFVEIWRKTTAGWQMSNDIWNSDLPAGAGTTLLHISHEVKDGGVWLDAWAGSGNRKEIFAQNGAPNVRVFQSPENANHVGLVAEISDMEAFMAWVTSPGSQTAKTEDGVIDSTLRFMTEVK